MSSTSESSSTESTEGKQQKIREVKTVLSPKFGGGPHGLGDPDDRSLRKVEREINIPKIVRDRTRAEKCAEEVAAFSKCAKETGLLVVVNCRDVNSQMKSCMERWYKDEDFVQECTEMYLEKRRQYRLTGERGAMKTKERILF